MPWYMEARKWLRDGNEGFNNFYMTGAQRGSLKFAEKKDRKRKALSLFGFKM